MFKAKLIENEKYYKLRSKQLFLMLLPSIPIGLIANFYQSPVWLTIIMLCFYGLIILLLMKNQRKIQAMLGNKLLEIDEEEIRIKSNKGEEVIRLDEITKIILKDEYSIPQETIKDIRKELTGETKQNYLILQKKSKKTKLDFEINSYYMINQLNKIIQTWESKGYKIERI